MAWAIFGPRQTVATWYFLRNGPYFKDREWHGLHGGLAAAIDGNIQTNFRWKTFGGIYRDTLTRYLTKGGADIVPGRGKTRFDWSVTPSGC